MDFDLTSLEAECFISDNEWKMIIESGTFVRTNKICHAIFKKRLLTFKITDVGNVELLNIRRLPCSKYKLPLIDNLIPFNKRAAAYLECERLNSGRELDDENFLIYGT